MGKPHRREAIIAGLGSQFREAFVTDDKKRRTIRPPGIDFTPSPELSQDRQTGWTEPFMAFDTPDGIGIDLGRNGTFLDKALTDLLMPIQATQRPEFLSKQLRQIVEVTNVIERVINHSFGQGAPSPVCFL